MGNCKLEVPPLGASVKGGNFEILLANFITIALVIAET
jgi:hypothetical protein